ncbi:M23 family metallopeptidase [Alphaproteobacteria bacterium]|nr:M23 family metallopeptidase [Alphaproteobacteria bacterium]
MVFILIIISFTAIKHSFAEEKLVLEFNNIVIKLQGNFTQGGLVKGKVSSNRQVKFENRNVLINSNGNFVIGFGRDYEEIASLEVKDSNKKWIKKVFNIKKRVYDTQSINGLEKKMVTPPESFYKRIRKENKSIKLVRNLNTEINYVFQNFIIPLDGIISGVFGSQRILNGKPRRPHYGIDIAAPKGSSVKAPTDSIVRMVEKDLYYTGGTLMLDHGHGVTSVYSHLSMINVKVGDKVLKGQKVAEVGSTGRSTGPHLDWRVNWFNQRLDPALLIN